MHHPQVRQYHIWISGSTHMNRTCIISHVFTLVDGNVDTIATDLMSCDIASYPGSSQLLSHIPYNMGQRAGEESRNEATMTAMEVM